MAASPYGLRIIEHTVPARMDAGETYGVRVTLENLGAMTWPAGGANRVHLFVLLGEALYQAVPLPHGNVAPGQRVTFHFALRLASAGTHRVRLELIHELRAWFSHHGAPAVAVEVQVERGAVDVTAVALERSLARNLWHYQPTSGIRRFRDGRPVPLFIARAKGCRIWDPEGHEFLDYTMGWGSTMLGYADERIQHAIAGCLDTSPLTPFPDPLEMEVSEMIAEDFPSVEMVAFGKNGSDVCTLAARLARIVASVQARLVPSQGKRAGRPSDASWVSHPKVPMSEATRRRLSLLAERASDGGRKVSPMQIAAQILEDALTDMQEP